MAASIPTSPRTWKNTYTEDFLSPLTWEIAAAFGYPNPFAPAPSPKPPSSFNQPISRLSRDQRRVSRVTL